MALVAPIWADELLGPPIPGHLHSVFPDRNADTVRTMPPCRSHAGQAYPGAEYVAGVDAYGDPVVPADVLASRPFPAPVVVFDIPVPRGTLPPRLRAGATAGSVTVDTADGAVLLDRDDIGSERSRFTNVTGSSGLKRGLRGEAVPDFPHPALDGGIISGPGPLCPR